MWLRRASDSISDPVPPEAHGLVLAIRTQAHAQADTHTQAVTATAHVGVIITDTVALQVTGYREHTGFHGPALVSVCLPSPPLISGTLSALYWAVEAETPGEDPTASSASISESSFGSSLGLYSIVLLGQPSLSFFVLHPSFPLHLRILHRLGALLPVDPRDYVILVK
ncbi:hypothetical protein CVT26_013902 [Gymnopilus dilepis]|uniref:Uncharacterized protein n=1 Tax=Gymnopilus dilepis TaxID=231916 RepID=A0A409WDQ8_9AGAR|nr:hypothetical protein CVT26_013902 [Gymnopilus dilepis]